jgi:hypothetical protein
MTKLRAEGYQSSMLQVQSVDKIESSKLSEDTKLTDKLHSMPRLSMTSGLWLQQGALAMYSDALSIHLADFQTATQSFYYPRSKALGSNATASSLARSNLIQVPCIINHRVHVCGGVSQIV